MQVQRKDRVRKVRMSQTSVTGVAQCVSPSPVSQTLTTDVAHTTQSTQGLLRERARNSEGIHRDPGALRTNSGEVRSTFNSELAEGIPSTLGLASYITYSAETWKQTAPDADDDEDGIGWGRMWTFWQLAKGHPCLLMASAADAWKAINTVVSQWVFPDKRRGWEFFEVDAEDAEVEFINCWNRIRRPGRLPALSLALWRAKATPIRLSDAKGERSERYPNFVSFVYWLQKGEGDKNIYLPLRTIAKTLSVSGATVSRYIQWALEDGYLVKVAESVGRTKAAEFKVAVTMTAPI
jgi:hypothetical protein